MNGKINPLPSLIRASATDAAFTAMREAGRQAWDLDDYNIACNTQERLIRSCYAREHDHNQSDNCYIRFSIAEHLERQGLFTLKSSMKKINRMIDAALK